MRVAIFGSRAFYRDVNLMINTILITVLLCIQGIVQPFKSKFQNFQQSLVLLNIAIINAIALYNKDNNSKALTVVCILIYAGSFYFIGYIICHCIIHAFGNTISKVKTMFTVHCLVWKQKFTSKKKLAQVMRMRSLRKKVSDVTYNYQEFQEPLIEID